MTDPADEDLSEYESEREVDAADDLHPAWRDELQRRLDSLADGTAVLHDLDDVEAEAQRLMSERVLDEGREPQA